ncbi:hypothetical protein BTN49_1117 [Candidatus Enterovibrio escicola]|uniref:Uncharacterized protein n=1 Tax=Candidatus Enterovibrio escicola TaxID=1927127 RepID=A0A2A5T4M7_9GAMM|nr:hypothetical protein BTN49_1117 [Candidatus Enterovibrio escacola]
MAVGIPAANSLAKVGPDNTASGTLLPNCSRATSCNKRPVLDSRPFVAQHTRESARKYWWTCPKTKPKQWLGTTTKMSRVAFTDSSRLALTISESGKVELGRYTLFERSVCNCAICSALCPHNTTLAPLRDSEIAREVPYEPAPNTVITTLCLILSIIFVNSIFCNYFSASFLVCVCFFK